MNAAHRSVVPQQPRSKRGQTNTRVVPPKVKPSSVVTNIPSRTVGQKVEKLNVSPTPQPVWLEILLRLQRGSDLITFILVTTTLLIYSWTVYTQQQWSQEYSKLQELQRQERQLTTTNAVMKNQLAQQAEQPATGLVTPTPVNPIVLPASPQRPYQTTPVDPEPTARTPLGY